MFETMIPMAVAGREAQIHLLAESRLLARSRLGFLDIECYQPSKLIASGKG